MIREVSALLRCDFAAGAWYGVALCEIQAVLIEFILWAYYTVGKQ